MSENVWLGVLAVGGGFALCFALLLVGLRAQGQASTGTRALLQLALCAVGLAATVALGLLPARELMDDLTSGVPLRDARLSGVTGPLFLGSVLLRMIWVRLPLASRTRGRGTCA